jgi:GrpB-like predicted nucleotidyltransferase (UPF0157 family)
MIQIESYNPEWKSCFDQLKQVLSSLLTAIPLDIQHVGSTAIPGLPAKPILDIDIIIEDKSLLTGVSARLEQAGYINRGDQGIPGRFAFRQQSMFTPETPDQQTWMEHHLYVCYADSLALKNHLLVRDALLQDTQLMAQYAGLKMQLVTTPGMTREEYTRQKTLFILDVLQKSGMLPDELRQISDSNR